MKKYLVLENGMSFEGSSFGADVDTVIAEIVFSTAMVGYVETLTDPRYIGQAVCQTFPVIGNYGVNEADCECSVITPSALIVREYCDTPSNFRSDETLDAFLRKHGIPAISGIDTRLLTKTLRDYGTMNGAITSSPDAVDLDKIKSYRVSDAVSRASTKSVRLETSSSEKRYKVALLDLGVTKSVVSKLNELSCDVYILPYCTSAEEILALNPDGIFISGGPGNPSDCPEVTHTLTSLIPKKIPTMAVGLGHQLLAVANGMKTEKLSHGHRGGNHPVRDIATGHLYITSQNHGYAVSSVNDTAVETFVNANDGTNEGLEYKNAPAFSVQFTPDTNTLSANTEFLYRHFIEKMESSKKQ